MKAEIISAFIFYLYAFSNIKSGKKMKHLKIISAFFLIFIFCFSVSAQRRKTTKRPIKRAAKKAALPKFKQPTRRLPDQSN